jgi:hypothetical protein
MSSNFATTEVRPVSFYGSALASIANLPLFLITQIIWVAGFLLFLVGLFRSLHNADRIVRRSQRLESDHSSLFRSVLNKQGLGDL